VTGALLAGVLALLQAQPATRPPATDGANRHEGVTGSQDSATRDGIGPPAAGVESGTANGMAGGRTDQASREKVGLRAPGKKARAIDRGPNAKGSLLAPADRAPTAAAETRSAHGGQPVAPAPAGGLSNSPGLVRPSKGVGGKSVHVSAPGGSATDGPAGRGPAQGGTGTDSGPHPE
jgi:hypothetical protein